MIATWYVEAGKYKVLPIDGSGLQRFAQERPQLVKARTSYTYFQDTQTVPWYRLGACAQPPAQHHRRCRDPQRRSRRRLALPGHRFGWLFVLYQGRQAEICPQLGEQGNLLRRVGRTGA